MFAVLRRTTAVARVVNDDNWLPSVSGRNLLLMACGGQFGDRAGDVAECTLVELCRRSGGGGGSSGDGFPNVVSYNAVLNAVLNAMLNAWSHTAAFEREIRAPRRAEDILHSLLSSPTDNGGGKATTLLSVGKGDGGSKLPIAPGIVPDT